MAGISLSLGVYDAPGNRSVRHEIIPVDVVHVTVSVIILPFGPTVFGRVGPHVRGKVGMGVFDTFIDNGHDDGGVSTGQFGPDVRHIDVGSLVDGLGNGRISIVDVMPLLGKHRIVEDSRAGGRRCTGRIGLAVGSAGIHPVVLDQLDAFFPGEILGDAFRIRSIRKRNLVPAVQAKALFKLFLSGCGRENLGEDGPLRDCV